MEGGARVAERGVSFDLSWQLVVELLLLGSVAGFLAGLLGVGGGAMLVPFMTILMSFKRMPEQHVVKMAIATSLATICFTSISSVRAHHRRGAVRWPLVKLLAPGIVIGALIGAQVAKALPSKVLALLFAGFIGWSAVQMFADRKPRPTRQLPAGAGLFAAGGAIGGLSSLMGAGGAFISVPFMVACNVPIINAVATSAALGFPIALAGTVGYIIAGWSLPDMPPGTLGFLYLPALLTLAAASMLAAPFGARAAHRMNVGQLKRAFGVLLLCLAGYMLYKGLSL
ncbi:MAG: membrane protein [Methylibium sp. NZG]|nr:MAG: membrane protein [Methylibium sp. NZG]KNZ34241.1 MAG: membrane protein [Methylibium sp. NZG]